ncbi:MAG: tryptophan-rich sensory protein [Parachlamydiales bacterium]|nr:tryptophan-rich sensory protein [Parachlamydiales bacterium]
MGFFIFLSVSLTIESFIVWILSYSSFSKIPSFSWISTNIALIFITFFFIVSTISIWLIWKNNLFKKVILEMSFYLSSLVLLDIWCYFFYVKNSFFLAHTILIILLVISVCLNILYWKKVKTASILSFYLTLFLLYTILLNINVTTLFS